jgi:hypothetical protein
MTQPNHSYSSVNTPLLTHHIAFAGWGEVVVLNVTLLAMFAEWSSRKWP